MMDKAFEVAVVFSAIDHLTRPMEQMATKMGVLDERTKQLQKRLNEFRNTTFVGGAITMAGAGLVKIMEDGLEKAGDFLTKMTIIKDTVGATADEMDRIQKTIRASSGPTIFGISETSGFAQKLATSGMSGAQINATLPVFTQFAEVQKLGKGTAPEESLTQAIGAAHMVGAYGPKDLLSFLDKYNKATFMQPGNSSEFADTFKYLAPSGAALGMKTDDMLTLSALANRVGLAGSMGGTNAADMILRSIPGLMGGRAGTKKDTRQMSALKELGLDNTIFDTSGQFKGVENFVAQLQKASAGQNPEKLAKLYHDIFGMQGMRLAQILSSERGQEQLKAITENMNQMKSISEMQEDINKTPEGQARQLKTNIENLKLTVWLELAKILLPILKGVNQLVGKIQEFADAHPRIAKMAAEFMTFAAAVALIVGPLLLITGAIGYLRTANALGTGFKLLGGAVKGSIGPMAGLAAAAFLLYNAWKYSPEFRETVKWLAEYIKKEIPKAAKNVRDFAHDIGLIDDNGHLSQTVEWFGKIALGILAAKKMMDGLKAVTVAWNLLSLANPWLDALLLISAAVLLLITHWNDVKKAIDDAADAMRKFLGTDPEHSKEKKYENAYDKFYNNPDYKPTNPDGAFVQHKPGGTGMFPIIGQTRDTLKSFQKWVRGYATGTDYFGGGLALVGERGPELLKMPRGTQIIPNHQVNDYLEADPYSHAPALGRSGGENMAQHTTIEKGAIVINAAPEHSEEDIAERVITKIDRRNRNQTWSRPTPVIPGVR
ncbi:MAG: phage tail tape measure protein [Desulfitobacteriaceae bacterium]